MILRDRDVDAVMTDDVKVPLVRLAAHRAFFLKGVAVKLGERTRGKARA